MTNFKGWVWAAVVAASVGVGCASNRDAERPPTAEAREQGMESAPSTNPADEAMDDATGGAGEVMDADAADPAAADSETGTASKKASPDAKKEGTGGSGAEADLEVDTEAELAPDAADGKTRRPLVPRDQPVTEDPVDE